MRLIVFVNSKDSRNAFQNLWLNQILFIIFSAIVLVFLLSHGARAETINIPDSKLRAVLERALNKQDGADITQVDMEKLEALEAFEIGITDLTGLEFAINLQEMRFGLNQISDLSQLKGLKKLRLLDLHRNGNITNISPLKDLSNLVWLSLRGNRIVDMNPLKNLKKLTYLHIGYNRISDVSPIKDLKPLTFLNLDENRIKDVSPLSDLINLRNLALDDNSISDISPLSVLTDLRYLNLNDNEISDISSLSVLVNLLFIDLHGNQVSDLTPLKDMIEMTNLRLQENRIVDISPLRGMTKLIRLMLHDNHISDFSPIAGVIDNLIEFDISNQTAPPPHLITELTFRKGDVNRDGIVDITDLVLIASHFTDPNLESLAKNNIYPDVNSDGVVNLIDLLLTAAELSTVTTAPTLRIAKIRTSYLTTVKLTQWIHLAKQRDLKDPRLLLGISVLEQLLTVLHQTEVLPNETVLLPNYPNPFNPETWIPFQLSKAVSVNISIHSIDGKLIRSLNVGQLSPGIYRTKSRAVHWDGRNALGEPVAAGVYFYTLTTGDYTATQKMHIKK